MDGPGVGALGLELVLIAADANLRESLPNLHLQDRCTSLTRSRGAPTVPGGHRRQVSLASVTAVVARSGDSDTTRLAWCAERAMKLLGPRSKSLEAPLSRRARQVSPRANGQPTTISVMES